MFPRIRSKDTLEMIEKKRLKFESFSFFEQVLEYLPLILIFGGLTYIAGRFLYANLIKQQNLLFAIVIFLLVLLLSFFVIYSRINATKLTRIKGINRSKNRAYIKTFSKKHSWELSVHNQDYSVLYKPWSWKSVDWGKNIFILYDKHDLLVCSIRYTRHYTISPFHRFANRKTTKRIKKELEIIRKNS